MKLMNKSMLVKMLLLSSFLLACVQFSFADDRTTTRDALAGIKSALTSAGAAALTSDQATALNALITAYNAARSTTPDATLQAALTAYETALLAGDLAAAQGQASIIATRKAALELAELQADAKFRISFLKTLTTAQVSALTAKFGSSGLLRLIGGEALAAPSGGRGRR